MSRAIGSGPIVAGQSLPVFAVNDVRSDHIRIMALVLRDPNPIHYDLAAVRAAGLGDHEVNQGASTIAYVLDLLVGWAGSRSAVRRIVCRFVSSVSAGDAVKAGGEVTAVLDSPAQRLVECRVWVRRPDGTTVLEGEATVAVPGGG